MKTLIQKIRRILKSRRTRQLLTRIVSITAAVVVFITTYALVLPAITMESEANCGIPAHQHDDSCYEDRLICGQVESPGHHHTDTCYSISKSLICTETEHRHDDSCFDADGNLICGLAEHTHNDSCYEKVRELTCSIPESDGHVHTADCYERVLICGMEAHTHSPACYSHASGNTASATAESAAVATTESGSYAVTVSDSASAFTGDHSSASADTATGDYSSASTSDTDTATSTTSDITTAAGTASDTATAASTTFNATAAENAFIPQLEPVIFEQLLTKDTGIYYFHAEENEKVPENSADITDWKRVNDDTELAPADLLRVYLRYTIPTGSINPTNDIARYRLPSNLHLTDQQMEAINTTVNGIASQYVSLDTLEITDTEKYNTYLGIEATEGTRMPSDDINHYFADHPELEGQEYITAVVRAENVFDDTTGEYIGQDLIFTFSPYTVRKNQHEYDTDGQPTKAGQKVDGWLCFDLHTDQIDWSEPVVSTTEVSAASIQDQSLENTEDTASTDITDTANATDAIDTTGSTDSADATYPIGTADASDTPDTSHTATDMEGSVSEADGSALLSSSDPEASNTNTIAITEKKESSAEIIFAAKDKTLKIDEISTELHLVELNTVETDNTDTQDEHDHYADDSADSTKPESELTAAADDDATDDSNPEKGKNKPESTDSVETDSAVSDAEDQSESAIEINAETYPAVSFEDTITVQAGTLSTDNETAAQDTPTETAITVSVIAESETFPLGTTMQLSAVKDMDTVASAVEGSVEGQTRGFHAVDISFHNADGEEIEPLKPIKVSMTSDAIKQAVEDSSTVPVVVHIETTADSVTSDSTTADSAADAITTGDSTAVDPAADETDSVSYKTGEISGANVPAGKSDTSAQDDTTLPVSAATIVETSETSSKDNFGNKDEAADTLSFDAGSFSVYAIVYTVDFHWEVDGKEYTYSIQGGCAITLSELLPIVGIVEDDDVDLQ